MVTPTVDGFGNTRNCSESTVSTRPSMRCCAASASGSNTSAAQHIPVKAVPLRMYTPEAMISALKISNTESNVNGPYKNVLFPTTSACGGLRRTGPTTSTCGGLRRIGPPVADFVGQARLRPPAADFVGRARLRPPAADFVGRVHLQPSTCHLPPATCHLQPVTFNLPPATCHLQPSTCHLSPAIPTNNATSSTPSSRSAG